MSISTATLNGLVDAALEISARRRDVLARMREAFERGDDEEALTLAKQLCGIENDDEQKRARAGSDEQKPRR